MMSVSVKVLIVGVCAAGLALVSAEPAAARCQVIAATHSAASKSEAAASAERLAIKSAEEIKAKNRWKRYSMSPRKVTPDPFWKAVRPVVPPEIILKPDVRTARTYSICWPGVVVPYVCTAGSMVCGS